MAACASALAGSAAIALSYRPIASSCLPSPSAALPATTWLADGSASDRSASSIASRYSLAAASMSPRSSALLPPNSRNTASMGGICPRPLSMWTSTTHSMRWRSFRLVAIPCA